MKRCYLFAYLTIVLAACYAPDYPEGRICAPDGSCPGDLVCDVNFLCFSPENASVVVPPEPPIPPPDLPPDAYGQPCFDTRDCFDGMHCYIDFESGQQGGFCTAVCGDGNGNVNEDICRYFDQGLERTFCFLSDDLNNFVPMYCGTVCDNGQACPWELICQEHPFFGPICTSSF